MRIDLPRVAASLSAAVNSLSSLTDSLLASASSTMPLTVNGYSKASLTRLTVAFASFFHAETAIVFGLAFVNAEQE